MYLKAEVVNNTFCKQLYKLMGNIVFGKMKLLNHLSEQYTFCTCSLGWEGRREEIPKGVLLMCTRKCWLIHMLHLTWLCSTNIFTLPPQFILLWLLNLDFLSKSSSPFSFHVPQGRSGDSFSQSIYSLICSNWFRERHTPNQSQWYVVKFFCRVCWEKGTFFFFAVRFRYEKSILAWNYWYHLKSHYMEAKNEETEKLQSPRKLETHWVLRTLFYFLNSAISKARSTLDLSDTWSNKSSFDKLLLVEFFKTCDQESHEWSTEQHDNLLRNKKPTGTLFFLSLLLKRRSTQCFWKFKHVSQGESNLFFSFSVSLKRLA